LREWYGFAIGAAFSGVVGVGSIQLWEIVFGVVLRPMAAILGLQQRLHNLELPLMVVNVFCGNCSTYCEMGIDVRSYAEKEKTLFVPPV
jgi:hypothetical protein